MMRPSLSRLRRLHTVEVLWRMRQMARIAGARLVARVSPPRWDRRDLLRRLTSGTESAALRAALSGERWLEAHVAVAKQLQAPPARFVIAPAMRERTRAEILKRFPDAAVAARDRGDRLVEGRYELLGYHTLDFDGSDWHIDPVHGTRAPQVFWADVPYLDPSCGDHKVTWEFNRHQHWLELGRAFWLTGDGRYRAECLRQLETWLHGNPPLFGINWASMLELGLRSISWIWAANFFAADAAADESPWLVDLLLSIDRQLNHVEQNLSHYFSPNTHLLGEALALYVGGYALPMLAASRRRTAVGRQLLLQEIGRQIAADGGHCEKSAHYHRYTLDFYLLALAVARLNADPAAVPFERACARLANAARLIADDAGVLPLIGDDDGGMLLPITRRRSDDVRDTLAIAAALTGGLDLQVDAAPEELWWVLGHEEFTDARRRIEHAPRAASSTSASLPITGYYVSRNTMGDHLVIDGGSHGYLNGGHAHADALSLTLTVRRQPLLVDTGTGAYTISPDLRERFRSSALHNTATLAGRSQSSPRGPFHWARTTDATTRRWRTNRRFDYFVGWHDGYAPIRHLRQVLMVHADLLVIADHLVGLPTTTSASQRTVDTAVHWHLHPEWSVQVIGSEVKLAAKANELTLHIVGGSLERFCADDEAGLGWYAPAYGRIEAMTTLRVTAKAAPPHCIVSVFTLDQSNATTGVTVVPFEVATTPRATAVAVHIDRERGSDRLIMVEPGDSTQPVWSTDGFESDAAMLFAREEDSVLAAVAVVDATTVRGKQHTGLEHHFASRVTDSYVSLRAGTDRRKAS
jgi:hypothetical protein